MPRGAVFVPFCYYEAAANMLTNPVLDPFGKIPEFKYCAVRVTKGGHVPEHSSFGGGTLLTDTSLGQSPALRPLRDKPDSHIPIGNGYIFRVEIHRDRRRHARLAKAAALGLRRASCAPRLFSIPAFRSRLRRTVC